MTWSRIFACGSSVLVGRCTPWRRCWPKAVSARDIVTQLCAATKALEQVGFRLIASGLTYCLQHPEEAAESGYPLDEVQRMFTKLA